MGEPKRGRTRVVGGAAAAAALALACAGLAGCSEKVGEAKTPPAPVVTVVEAKRMTVPLLAEPIGTTRALQEVSIRARVRGFLKEIQVEEGAEVKAEQLLFVIDEEPFKAKVAEAQAALEQAEAALKKAKDSKAREVATAQLGVSRSMMALSEVEERREQALYKRNATSIEDVQRKQAIHQRDVAQVEADKASLEQANADFETNALAAQADVDGAKARLLDAQINLGYCRMTSPIDGRIGFVQVKVGNLIGPGASGGGADYKELAVVRQLDPMGVDIQVASRYLDRVVPLVGQGLALEVFRPGLSAEETRRYTGKLTAIDNTIDTSTSTFRVQAEVANPEKALLPGEYVKANVKVGELREAVVVPEQAVIESQAGPTVYTVDADGKVALAPVSATTTYNGLRVLESGVEPGQLVVIEGLQLVRAGQTVKPERMAFESLRPVGSGSAEKPAQASSRPAGEAKGKAEAKPDSRS